MFQEIFDDFLLHTLVRDNIFILNMCLSYFGISCFACRLIVRNKYWFFSYLVLVETFFFHIHFSPKNIHQKICFYNILIENFYLMPSFSH